MATLRKAANPIKSSLKSVASNKGMKKADAKGTVKLAEKTLSAAKQKLRTHDASMGGTKQQHDALKKQVKTAERNLKSLNKTASKVNNKDLSKSLGSVASNKGIKKSNIRGTMSEQRNRYYNAMVDADKALDRVNRAGTNKNERAYAEQSYFKAKDKMKAAAKQYNSLKKLKK